MLHAVSRLLQRSQRVYETSFIYSHYFSNLWHKSASPPSKWSRRSSVSIVTRPKARRPRVRGLSAGRGKRNVYTGCWPNPPSYSMCAGRSFQGAQSEGVKLPGHKTDTPHMPSRPTFLLRTTAYISDRNLSAAIFRSLRFFIIN
jgi:hypothetical protein